MKSLALTRPELEALVAAMAQAVMGRGRSPRCGCDAEAGKHKATDEPAGIQKRGLATDSHELARLALLFDHTLLKPEATAAQIEKASEQAVALGCSTLVVQPAWVSLAAKRLSGSAVKPATVVGFPFGADLISMKRAQAEAAIRAGAREIDMVMNVGMLRSGDSIGTGLDIRGVVETCHAAEVQVKVILENALLTGDQKKAACLLAVEAGADFVKTSTGFGPSGATIADVKLMREAVGPHIGVKAAGGIRTLADVLGMLQAGANRIGTSATVSILAEARASTG